MIPLMFFKIGCLDKASSNWIRIYEILENRATPIDLTLSLLKLQEGIPCILSWLPSHPILKDTSCPLYLAQHLLHQGILVPELVDSW